MAFGRGTSVSKEMPCMGTESSCELHIADKLM